MKIDITTACATIDLLAATWPACFATRPAERRPLKVGIDRDIAAAAEGAIAPEELRAALRLYVTHKRYLRKLREGAQRVDLDGNSAGVVTAEQADMAHRQIERIEQRQSQRVRAQGLAKEAAAREARAAAERAQREAEDAKRLATGRKPVLRLSQRAAAAA